MSNIPSLEKRVFDLMESCSASVSSGSQNLNEIFELRYKCYFQEGLVHKMENASLQDCFDRDENSLNVRFEIDGKICAAIRLHVLTAERRNSPTTDAFGDIIFPLLDAGFTIIDPNRFVIDRDISSKYPELLHVVLRIPFMAASKFGAQKALAAVRPKHQSFYKRYLAYQTISPPRPYSQLTRPLGLMLADFESERDKVTKRYPFFDFDNKERDSILNQNKPLGSRKVPACMSIQS